MSHHPEISMRRMLAALMPYALRRWGRLLALALTTLLVAGLAVLKPWPMKFVVDHALLDHPLPALLLPGIGSWPGMGDAPGRLAWGVAASVAVFLAFWSAGLMHALAQVAFGQRVVFDLSCDLFARLQRLSLQFHARRSTGDTIRRVTGDCGCVSAIVKDAFLPIVSAAVTLVAMLVIMIGLNPLLTLISLAVVPMLVLVLRRHAGPMMQRSYEQQTAEGQIYAHVERTFSAIPVVQVCRRERLNDRQFVAHAQAAVAAALASTNVQLRFKVLAGLCTAIGTATIIYIGATQVMDGRMTVGTLLVFLAYLAALYRPVESLVYSSFTIHGAAGSARRVVELLEVEQHPGERDGALALTDVRGEISFESITCGYDDDRDVLHDLTLHVPPGQTLAIVGATGAGKSTLAGLIPRFIDPRRGVVRIDGHDVRDLTLESLRRHVAIVPQESFLFPMTVAENIAYGRPEATHDQIIAAARAAEADDFIRQLPHGYETPVGERGATLSGGQRQRIAIARALLKDAPILILDEPTSGLDPATESAVMVALRALMRGRTTLVIAHRLSTVRDADRIVVLDSGRIIEQGTHPQLLASAGMYAAFWASAGDVSTEVNGNEGNR